MQFLYPWFLWGLLLLAVPLIIHLFYFRKYKRALFTQVRFLKELVEETSYKNRLKNLLILLLRLLALTAIIIAFAQPYTPNNQEGLKKQNLVNLFIDNSHSMSSEGTNGSLFSQAKSKALEIVKAYTDYDKFCVFSHSLNGRQTRLLSKEEAITAIEEINEESSVQVLSRILTKIKSNSDRYPNLNSETYVISDFQQSIIDHIDQNVDTISKIHFIPVQSIAENNLSIDTVYFAQPVIIPGQINPVLIEISNYSGSDVTDIRVSYTLNGQEFPFKSVEIPAYKKIQDTIKINLPEEENLRMSVKIKDFPIQFDDEYFITADIDKTLEVLIVYEGELPTSLQRAILSIPYFKTSFQSASQLDYSQFDKYKLIILVDLTAISSGLISELNKAMESGSNIVVFPAPDLHMNAYEGLARQYGIEGLGKFDRERKEVGKIELEGDIFSDVFVNKKSNIKLPVTFGQYRINSRNSIEVILSYRDGSPFLVKQYSKGGNFYFFSIPWNEKYSDLAKNPEILLPFIFKAAVSNSLAQKHSFIIGSEAYIHWKSEPNWIKPESGLVMKGPEEFIPSLKPTGKTWIIEIYDQIQKPGMYTLSDVNSELEVFAFNESRRESDPKIYTSTQLKEMLGESIDILEIEDAVSLGSAIKEKMDKKSHWWILLLLSVFFLFLEGLIIRFWKNS